MPSGVPSAARTLPNLVAITARSRLPRSARPTNCSLRPTPTPDRGGSPMQKITPFLWFDSQAEEAAKFYVSLFPNSKIVSTTRYGDAGPGPKGQVMTVSFELAGTRFTALNGGPQFKFN